MNTIEIDKEMVSELRQKYDAIVSQEEGIARDIAFQTFQISGANAINDLIANDEMDTNTINLVLGSLVDLQVRDYAVGITTENNRDKLINIWSALAIIAPEGSIAPVATLCAIANYESGNEKTALEWLSKAQKDESDYPLAKLISRVIGAGWGSEQFGVMREQLHPKVVATIYGKNNENN
jgi:hypothetical protein